MHDSSAPEGCRSGDHRIFHPYLPYVKVCGALLKSMSTISFTRCSNASGHGLFMTGAESRTCRPILPKLRTPGGPRPF